MQVNPVQKRLQMKNFRVQRTFAIKSAASRGTMTEAQTAAMDAFLETKKWTPEMDGVLGEMSSTGQSQFEWAQFKQVIAVKLEAVCAEYHGAVQDLPEAYDAVLKRLLALLEDFPNAPFTVQRLCELLLDPHRIYATSTRKVTSAFEKLLTVSSTVPTMAVARPKEGTYQAASEASLGSLVGDGAAPMEVEN